MRQHGARDLAHQPEAAATIDEADPGLGHQPAQRPGGRHMRWVLAGVGAAVHTDAGSARGPLAGVLVGLLLHMKPLLRAGPRELAPVLVSLSCLGRGTRKR